MKIVMTIRIKSAVIAPSPTDTAPGILRVALFISIEVMGPGGAAREMPSKSPPDARRIKSILIHFSTFSPNDKIIQNGIGSWTYRINS
jgi:hypothetical protein